MSHTNAGLQAIAKSSKSLRGEVRDESLYTTYTDLSGTNLAGYRKDQRRQRLENSRRKMLHAISR